MATDLEIVNNALYLLGDDEITSGEFATPTTKRAKLLKALWPTARQFVLRSHPWNFAVKRATPSAAAAPLYEWPYAFTLPADCLRLLAVGEEGEVPLYRLEGRTILTDETPINITYLADITDPATWDAAAVEAMTAYLAMKAAYPLTKSNSTAEAMAKLFSDTARMARTLDGQEQPWPDAQDFPLLAARRA
jgi:hypothetical protein